MNKKSLKNRMKVAKLKKLRKIKRLLYRKMEKSKIIRNLATKDLLRKDQLLKKKIFSKIKTMNKKILKNLLLILRKSISKLPPYQLQMIKIIR